VVRGRLGGGMVGLGLGVDRDSLVGHIGHIAVVVVGGVLDVLGPAIGQSNAVGSGHGAVGIGGLSGVESGLGVVISHTVLESIGSRLLLIVGAGLVGSSRGRVVGGGLRVVWGRGDLHDRGVVDNRGRVVGSGSRVVRGSMVHSGHNSVGNWGRVVRGGLGVVWGRVVGSRVVRSRGVVGHSSGGMHSGHSLLVMAVSMHRLGRGMGLAGNAGVVGAMRLVHSHGNGGSITVLDDLVVGLVRGDHGQKGGSDKGLHVAL